MVGSAAALIQLALAIPVLAVGGSDVGDRFGGFMGVALALLWGGMTLFAAWSWVFGRWRVVLAPVVTTTVLLLASTVTPT